MASIGTPQKVEIIKEALILIGEPPISSLSDNTNAVRSANAKFEGVYEYELQGNRWRFAMKKAQLSQLVGAPLNEWQHAYQLPADMLLPIGVYPRTRYEIYADHLYANSNTIEMDYLFKPDITEVPRYFAKLLEYALALELARPVRESESSVDQLRADYTMIRARAMYADAQGRPNRPLHSPFTEVR